MFSTQTFSGLTVNLPGFAGSPVAPAYEPTSLRLSPKTVIDWILGGPSSAPPQPARPPAARTTAPSAATLDPSLAKPAMSASCVRPATLGGLRPSARRRDSEPPARRRLSPRSGHRRTRPCAVARQRCAGVTAQARSGPGGTQPSGSRPEKKPTAFAVGLEVLHEGRRWDRFRHTPYARWLPRRSAV